jgi:hypothetical protein
MKKQKLSDYNRRVREERIIHINKEYGDEFNQFVSNGYTVNQLGEHFNISDRFVYYYSDYFNLTDDIKQNNIRRIQSVARKNGAKSANILAGVPLKPFSDEIVNWYKECISNGMYRMEVMNQLKEKFGYGRKKYGQLVNLYGIPVKNHQSGKQNPMYGKSPGKNSGNGIKAFIIYDGKKIYCRSLLELRIFLFLIDNNIKFELSKHRINYILNDKPYTYQPDIIFMGTNIVAEIKPTNLINSNLNVIKFKAAKEYCKKYKLEFQVITETTYDLNKFDLSLINNYIDRNIVVIDKVQYERLKNNLK